MERKFIVIASSDFTHSGQGYGNDIDMKIDKEAIESILKLDTEGFLKQANKTTICGDKAIGVVIEIAKLIGVKRVELLDYYDSSSVIDSSSKVGYASIAFFA